MRTSTGSWRPHPDGEDCAVGDVRLAGPHARGHVQRLGGIVESIRGEVDPVMDTYIDRANRRNQELMAGSVCMTTTGKSGRNVEDLEHPFDRHAQLAGVCGDKCSSLVRDRGEVQLSCYHPHESTH